MPAFFWLLYVISSDFKSMARDNLSIDYSKLSVFITIIEVDSSKIVQE